MLAVLVGLEARIQCVEALQRATGKAEFINKEQLKTYEVFSEISNGDESPKPRSHISILSLAFYQLHISTCAIVDIYNPRERWYGSISAANTDTTQSVAADKSFAASAVCLRSMGVFGTRT